MCFLLVVGFIISTSASKCLERPVSKMTCYVFSGTLNSAYCCYCSYVAVDAQSNPWYLQICHQIASVCTAGLLCPLARVLSQGNVSKIHARYCKAVTGHGPQQNRCTFSNWLMMHSRWPLTWKAWKSRGITKWSGKNGKSQGNWNLLNLGVWTRLNAEVAAIVSLWAWSWDMFLVDTIVVFRKSVTMLESLATWPVFN